MDLIATYTEPKRITINRTDDARLVILETLSPKEWKVLECLHSFTNDILGADEISNFELSFLLDLSLEDIEQVMSSLNDYSIVYKYGKRTGMDMHLCGNSRLSIEKNGKRMVHYYLAKIRITSKELQDEYFSFKKQVDFEE